MGRWRTPEEAALRVMSDRAMRGVQWAGNDLVLLGRAGDGFLIRMHCNGTKLLSEIKSTETCARTPVDDLNRTISSDIRDRKS